MLEIFPLVNLHYHYNCFSDLYDSTQDMGFWMLKESKLFGKYVSMPLRWKSGKLQHFGFAQCMLVRYQPAMNLSRFV